MDIRELQNVIERETINSLGSTFALTGFESFKKSEIKQAEKIKILQEIECDHIISVLDKTDWVVEGTKGAAKILGLNPSTLRRRMRKYGIIKQKSINKYRMFYNLIFSVSSII